MKPLKYKGLFLAVSLMVLPIYSAQAGLGTEMQKIFDGMKNSTPPGVYESQNRMTLDGGGYFERVPITDTNLVNMEFPSFSGGCGGIDMNFGSLSFINGDQFLQLLTNIGKNAKGYIFQLAMDNVFPEGAKWMDSMQEKIAEMNRFLGNSCQAAQLAVNHSGLGKLVADGAKEVRASAKGLVEDPFSASTGGDDGNTSADHMQAELCASDKNECLLKQGNLTYKSLKRQDVKSWFVSNDQDMLPVLLSIAGSKVIKPLEVDPADTGKQAPIESKPGHFLKLEHLVKGGNVPVYKCEDFSANGHTFTAEEDCLVMTQTTANITGLHPRIRDAIAGSATNPGVIDKWADSSIGSVTPDEKQTMALLPQGVGGLLKAISRRGSPGAAKAAAANFTESLAYYAAFQFTEESLKAVERAINDSVENAENNLMEQIQQARSEYFAELEAKISEGSILPIPNMISHAQALMSVLPKHVPLKLE